jgi:hypothetical protein
VVEYGDYQVELQDGTQSAGEILGGREDGTVRTTLLSRCVG